MGGTMITERGEEELHPPLNMLAKKMYIFQTWLGLSCQIIQIHINLGLIVNRVVVSKHVSDDCTKSITCNQK